MKSCRIHLLALIAAPAIWLGLSAAPAQAQTTYTWNNSGTDPSAPAAWNPSGQPTATDLAQFTTGGSAFGAAVQNPIFGGAFNSLSLTTALNQNGGGWNFTVANPITLGGTGSTGLTTFGPQTTILNGPTLVGSGATTLLNLNVNSGSVLVLSGTTAVTANQGNINVNGGIFRLDNTVTNNTARLLTTGTIKLNGSGTFELVGNSAGGTYNVGALNAADNSTGGTNTIRVVPNTTTAPTILNFANAAAFSLRQGTRNTTVFDGGTGTLGGANGPRITFAALPFVSSSTTGNGAGNLFANTATGATSGFAITKDALGTNFATYSTTAGVGVISIATGGNGNPATITTVTTASGLVGATPAATSGFNYQYNSSATANTTAATGGIVTGATLRITPGAAGGVLDLGASALNVNAIMLDGTTDFTIAGSGTFSSGSTKYIYVNNATTVLSTSLNIAPSSNTVLAGPGFIDLIGTATQNTAGASRITLGGGGVLRANNTNFGFTSAGVGQLNLNGGVLEIKNGGNQLGTTADFTRAAGSGTGTLSWTNTATANSEQGSGGFSAFGAPATVNIGGTAVPAALTWNVGSFVGNGYALQFGSTKSNAVLSFLNPIVLDAGTAYQSREVRVTRGVGGDKTVFAGAISGPVTADFVKTGNGLLELNQPNTYTGRTYVTAGTLSATNTTGSGTGTGPVNVLAGGTLAGTGTLNPGAGNTVTIAAGGTVRGGDPSLASGLGTLTVNRITIVNGGNVYIRIPTAGPLGAFSNGASSAGTLNAPANNNYIRVTDFNGLTTDPNSINYILDGAGSTFVNGQFYSYVIGRVDGTPLGAAAGTVLTNDQARFTFNNFNLPLDTNISLSGDDLGYIYVNFTPVPEPTTIVGLSAAVLALGGYVRRRRHAK